MMFIRGFSLFCLFCYAVALEQGSVTQLFVKLITNDLFFNSSNSEARKPHEFRASLEGHPDLPRWLHYINSSRNVGILFGSPPDIGITTLDLVAINKETYQTTIKSLNISIADRAVVAKNEVEVKVWNFDVEDLLKERSSYLSDLRSVFIDTLWKSSSKDLYNTFMESPVGLGGRRLPHKNSKEGVIVRFGSEAPYSDQLLRIQKEVQHLYKHAPCPKNFKKTSAERHFRAKGFQVDWCGFKLVRSNSGSESGGVSENFEAYIDSFGDAGWDSRYRYDIPMRDYTQESILTLLLPICSALVLISLLSALMCLNKDGLRGPATPEVQMLQYPVVARASVGGNHYRSATPASSTPSIRRSVTRRSPSID